MDILADIKAAECLNANAGVLKVNFLIVKSMSEADGVLRETFAWPLGHQVIDIGILLYQACRKGLFSCKSKISKAFLMLDEASLRVFLLMDGIAP
jgi:hypothetical protein